MFQLRNIETGETKGLFRTWAMASAESQNYGPEWIVAPKAQSDEFKCGLDCVSAGAVRKR